VWINAFIKPFVKFFSFPFYILTLGLFAFVVNAAMLEIVNWVSGITNLNFHIDDFFWSALGAAVVVTFVSMILNLLLPDGDLTFRSRQVGERVRSAVLLLGGHAGAVDGAGAPLRRPRGPRQLRRHRPFDDSWPVSTAAPGSVLRGMEITHSSSRQRPSAARSRTCTGAGCGSSAFRISVRRPQAIEMRGVRQRGDALPVHLLGRQPSRSITACEANRIRPAPSTSTTRSPAESTMRSKTCSKREVIEHLAARRRAAGGRGVRIIPGRPAQHPAPPRGGAPRRVHPGYLGTRVLRLERPPGLLRRRRAVAGSACGPATGRGVSVDDQWWSGGPPPEPARPSRHRDGAARGRPARRPAAGGRPGPAAARAGPDDRCRDRRGADPGCAGRCGTDPLG
jgi:hypothetical protein